MLEELLARASLTLETAATLLRRLSIDPWIYGTDRAATIPAGLTFVTIRHGLGRAMNGAVIVGCTDASVTASVDISRDVEFVTVRISAVSPADFTVKLRCF